MAMTSQADGSVKYHNVCVLDEQLETTRIVATLHSASSATGSNSCNTGRDEAAQAVGYWDLGRYGVCSAQGDPSCRTARARW